MIVKDLIELLKLCVDQDAEVVISYPNSGYEYWIKSKTIDTAFGNDKFIITVDDKHEEDGPYLEDLDMDERRYSRWDQSNIPEDRRCIR